MKIATKRGADSIIKKTIILNTEIAIAPGRKKKIKPMCKLAEGGPHRSPDK